MTWRRRNPKLRVNQVAYSWLTLNLQPNPSTPPHPPQTETQTTTAKMSRQIDQALLSLMPTYTQDLPPTLLELANSLLAQSRHRASMLKAEEEVARLYACANIACDR